MLNLFLYSSSSVSRDSTVTQPSSVESFPVDTSVTCLAGSESTPTGDNGLQLDSSSSSDNESDIEFSAQLNASSALNACLSAVESLQQRDSLKEQSPAPPSSGTPMPNVSSAASLSRSEGELEMDRTQSTMWLGTEDGCVHVYNCTDNIRIKKNKIKIQHSSAVYSIL